MTIENLAIELLIAEGICESVFAHDRKKYIREAIRILFKYQKIEQIVAKWEADTWTDGISSACMAEISEVLKDEKEN